MAKRGLAVVCAMELVVCLGVGGGWAGCDAASLNLQAVLGRRRLPYLRQRCVCIVFSCVWGLLHCPVGRTPLRGRRAWSRRLRKCRLCRCAPSGAFVTGPAWCVTGSLSFCCFGIALFDFIGRPRHIVSGFRCASVLAGSLFLRAVLVHKNLLGRSSTIL